MRRLLVFALLSALLAAPAAARAIEGGPGPKNGDGTLSVKRGKGTVGMKIDGVIIGRLRQGRITAYDPDPTDGSGPILKGCERKRDISDQTINPDDVKVLCSGNDIRFRLIGGKYMIQIRGSGIFLSAVGHGMVYFDGRGDITGEPDGVYSLNGDPYESLPDVPTQLPLQAPPGG
jgi:hypothetical protein